MTVSFRLQLRIYRDEEIALGPGKADLLAAIMETGSISAAGRKMGMSYRRAWLLVDTMNRCFKSPVVESSTGGKHGGGAQLTTFGEEILKLYRSVQVDTERQAESYFKKFKSFLAP